MSTPNHNIPYVPEGTLDPAAGLNLALNVLDVLVQTAVISMDLTAPPGSPSDGDLYVVGFAPTGAWSGQARNVARYVAEGASWQFFDAGSQVFYVLNRADGGLYKFIDESPLPNWTLAAGLSDAPNDGQLYTRQSLVWVATQIPPLYAPVVNAADEITDATDGAGNYTRFTHPAAIYYFDDAGPWTVGEERHGRYAGSGTLTITSGTGFTINPPAGGSLVVPPGGTFTVKIVAADEADLFGVTVPA